MQSPLSDKPGELVRRAFASYVVACWLMEATIIGVFLLVETDRVPLDASTPFIILLGPILVPVMLLAAVFDWFTGARQGNQTWWMLPAFATIWAGCFVFIGRLMRPRDRV